MSYPIVRKGTVVTPHHTGYGASVERYQKRFSRKDVAKLQKKLAKFQQKLAKLQSKTSRLGANIRARRINRLEKKIQAIQALLGMQPFDASIQADAMEIANETTNPSPLPLILGISGALLVGGLVFYKTRQKKRK